MSYSSDISLLLIDIRFRFHEINDDQKLTPEDKKRIKEFFLQNIIAPKARKVVEKYFPEEIGKAGPKPATSNARPHPDRR